MVNLYNFFSDDKIQDVKGCLELKMPKIDTLDALNDETTSMLKTLTHSLSFSGSKRYIYIGGNKSFGAHTAESLCFQWDADLLHKT